MENKIHFKINEKEITALAGITILQAARDNEIIIPTLCDLEGLSSVGACRLCLVEIKGIPRLLTACTTEATEGMQIQTETPKLKEHRSMIIEMLLAERNHTCSACVSNNNCELQGLATTLGVTHSRFPYRYPNYKVDASHSRFAFDPNRCILCSRCVRACHEIEGAGTWSVMGRGINSGLTIDLNTKWGDSETCTSCGKCVEACPTGALFEKGSAAAEMKKQPDVISKLSCMRTSSKKH